MTGPGLRHVEHAMGTVFSFDIRDPATPAVRRALNEAAAWLHRVDEVFSTYRPDSPVSRLDRGETTLDRCPPEVAEVLRLCGRAEWESGGWFSATAGGRLDPSGLVKGWAVEHASRLLHGAGARHTCVNGGGDLRLRGGASPAEPWRVGIAHPLHRGRLAAVVTARDLAVATSGPAERGRHILDPHTAEPARGPASITVTGPDLTWADAYATAAWAMGPRARSWIAGRPGHEALAVTAAGRVWTTDGFPLEAASNTPEYPRDRPHQGVTCPNQPELRAEASR